MICVSSKAPNQCHNWETLSSGATSLVTTEKHPLRIINVIQNRGRHKASYHDNDIYLSIAQLKKHPTLTLSTINMLKKKTPRTVVVWSTHSQKINYTRKAAEQTPLSFRNETQAVYRDVRITSNVSTRWPAETFFCFFSPSRSHGLLFSLAQADITCSVSTVSAASNGNSMSQWFTAHWGWYKQCAHFWEPFISLDAFSMRKWKLLPR